MIGRIVNRIIGPFGLQVTGKSPFVHPLATEEYLRFESIVRKNTMVPQSVLLSLYDQLLYCERNPICGDYVECGVWRGGAVGMMALVNLAHGQDRRNIHMFDVFGEICEPDKAVDGERAIREAKPFSQSDSLDGRLSPLTGIYDSMGGPGTVESVNDLLANRIGYPLGNLCFHKGWFQDVVPTAAKNIGDIAVLRLDGDWYASTKVCMEFLFDKVVQGGFVIIDDYGAYEGCKKAIDESLSSRGISRYLNYVNEETCYLIV